MEWNSNRAVADVVVEEVRAYQFSFDECCIMENSYYGKNIISHYLTLLVTLQPIFLI